MNQKSESSFGTLTIFILGVVTLAALFGGWLGQNTPKRGGLSPGQIAPPIKAAGWINGDAPQTEGKVVVVDAWATWCLPCKQEAPYLVKTHDQFRDRDDLVFIGLTSEEMDALPAIERWLNETGITWVNGYGASETLLELQANYIPAVWVIDRHGKVVWNFDSQIELAEAIQIALDH